MEKNGKKAFNMPLKLLLRTSGAVRTQMSPVQHVKHTARCAHHYVRGFSLKLLNFTTEVGSSNTGVTRCSHVVTQSQDDLLDLMEKSWYRRVSWTQMRRVQTALQNNFRVISTTIKGLSMFQSVPKDGMPSYHSSPNINSTPQPDQFYDWWSHGQRLHQSWEDFKKNE